MLELDGMAYLNQVLQATEYLNLTDEQKNKLQTRNILLQALYMVGKSDCNHLFEKEVKV